MEPEIVKQLPSRRQEFQSGNTVLVMESDVWSIGGRTDICDTNVYVGDQLLCVIAGNKIDNFKKDFLELVNNYSI